MRTSVFSILTAAVVLTSCGGEQPQPAQEAAPAEKPAKEVPAVAELVIEANDQMLFNTKRLDVHAGQKVRLTLKNVGVQPKETMGHNWTLLKKDVNLEEFAMAAMTAKDNEYLPADRLGDVIVSTRLLGPGESETIEFDAPEVGVYKFLCTFPGHFGGMQGSFVVLE